MARRPPRRPPGDDRALPPGALGGSALQMLRQANRSMERGQHAQAYALFKRLADGAARRDMPLRAAHLYIRAAHARLEMGSAEDALSLARQGIGLLSAAGQSARLGGLLPRLVQELARHGHHDAATRLRAEMSVLLAGDGVGAAPQADAGRLPARCPACGAPLRAQEVTWIDGHSAECAYCGTPMATE